MKRIRSRVIAMLMAGLVVGSQLTGNAAADVPTLQFLKSEDCRSYQPTADAQVPQAWHLDRLQMNRAWEIATGRGVTVAVIDTGAAATGTPFFDATFETWDYLGGMSEQDQEAGGIDCDHGTKVASLIAAGRADGQPIDLRTDFSGVAPDATIISYRVLTTSGGDGSDERDDLEATIEAVRNATERGVQVINLSQAAGGGDPRIPEYEQVIEAALAAGIVVVASAGNADQGLGSSPAFPAAFDGVISVGMVDRTDAPDPMSHPGPNVSVGAPGSDLMALLPSTSRENAAYTNQAYESGLVGTSFAAPIVSGVVALMLEADPSLTPAQVKERLELTADPPPNTVPEAQIGYGIVNPMRALTGLARPQEPNPETDRSAVPYQLPEPVEPDMRPAWIGVGVGAGALVVTALGMVVAFTLPAAARRRAAAR